MKTAVFIYEAKHVEQLDLLPALGENETLSVIACNAEVELVLTEKNIHFVSARNLRTMPVSERLIFTRKLVSEILESKAFSFFEHRKIHLGTLYTPTLQYYLAVFLYYVDIVITALETDSYDRVMVLATAAPVSPTGGLLHVFDIPMISDAVKVVCTQKNIPVTVHDFFMHVPQKARSIQIKRSIFGGALFFLNSFVSLVPIKKKIRILASENWKNIAPLMQELPDSELFLLDRAESMKAGLQFIWRNRMRFIHANDFLSSTSKKIVREKSKKFSEDWQKSQNEAEVLSNISFRNCSLSTHMNAVLSRIVTVGGEWAVRDIEATYALCEKVRPNIVIVRAGTSAQTHFAVLCKVARELGIPSLEIQHGTLYFGPESFSTQRAAEYVAEYGPLVRRDLKTIGYDDEHLFDVGSPRFDLYKTALSEVHTEENAIFSVGIIAPQVVPGYWTDSYDVYDFFENIGRAMKNMSNASVIIKAKPSPQYESFYRETIAKVFKDTKSEIIQDAPMIEVLAKATVVISAYSTALLESLLLQRPTIFFTAGIPMYETFALGGENAPAAETGALAIIHSVDELGSILNTLTEDLGSRKRFAEAAHTFMEQEFSFNELGAKTLAGVVRTLAGKATRM